MRTATVTTILNAPREKVFDDMADIENLPRWATEFARELHRDDDGYRVVNGLGEFAFEIRADGASGVVDMFAGPTRDRMAVFPTRAVALPDGRTAFSFTMFQGPDMPDELFEAQHASLCREFENMPLKRPSAFAPGPSGPWPTRWTSIASGFRVVIGVAPAFWITGSRTDMRWTFSFAPDGAGTQLGAVAELTPRGAMRLLAPLLGPMLRRTFSKRPAQLAEGVAKRRATTA